MKLNEYQRELVEQNFGLVLRAAKRLSITSEDYEELVSVGAIGLCDAAKAYEEVHEEREIKFSTYALRCIKCEMRKYLHENSQKMEHIKLFDKDDEEMRTILKSVQAANEELEKVEDTQVLASIFSKLLNRLRGRELAMFLCDLALKTHKETAELFGVTPSTVKYWLDNAKKTVKKLDSVSNNKARKCYVTISDAYYEVEIFGNDERRMESAFSKFFSKVEKIGCASIDYAVRHNKKRITLLLPRESEALIPLAMVLLYIDE